MDYFKNNTNNLTIVDSFENEFNIENDFDKVTLHGSLSITLDQKGLNRVVSLLEQLKIIEQEITQRIKITEKDNNL